MSVYTNASLLDGNFSSPTRFPARATSSSSCHPNTGQTRGSCERAIIVLSGLSCPGVGDYEDDSVVHFVMFSLTYEFWAIFQNFSQGGYSHLQGLGGMQPGSQGGGRPSASNEPAADPKKYLLWHTRLSLPFWGCRLEGQPLVVLIRSFCWATCCNNKFVLILAHSCALVKTCLRARAVSWLRLRRVVNDRPQRFLIDEVLSSSGLGLQGGSRRRLGGQQELKSNTTHLRASLFLSCFISTPP